MGWRWELRELAVHMLMLFASTVAMGMGLLCVLWIATALSAH
jgi:hypothetical protein